MGKNIKKSLFVLFMLVGMVAPAQQLRAVNWLRWSLVTGVGFQFISAIYDLRGFEQTCIVNKLNSKRESATSPIDQNCFDKRKKFHQKLFEQYKRTALYSTICAVVMMGMNTIFRK